MEPRLAVGIDFSTQWADTSLMAPDGTPIIRHQRFDNSLPGFESLEQRVLTGSAASLDAFEIPACRGVVLGYTTHNDTSWASGSVRCNHFTGDVVFCGLSAGACLG